MEAELVELASDAFYEKAYVVAAHTELNKPLDDVVGVLIHNEINDRTILQLSDKQLSLVFLRKFESYVDDAAAVLIFRQFNHVPVYLINNDGAMECFTVFNKFLDNVVAKYVDSESFQAGQAFVENHLAEAVISFIKLSLNEPASKLVLRALDHIALDAHRVDLVLGGISDNLKDLLQKWTPLNVGHFIFLLVFNLL